jgi:sugar lactone lactonase YvrE
MRSPLAFANLSVLWAAAATAGEPTVITRDAAFPEGPTVSGGKLLYAEYGAHKVSQWDGSTVTQFWSQDGCGPSAVVPMGDNFAITCYDNGQMVVVSAEGKTIASYGADDTGAPLVGPNDGTPDGKGGIFFTTSGPWESGPIVGRVLHLSAAGKIRELADDLHYANGIALAKDGQLLFVNESEAGRVITFHVGPDGSLSDRRLFVRLSALDEPVGAYPDGIKIGPDGNLYIGQYSAGRILVVDDKATLRRKIDVPSPAAPNLTFSDDGKMIYVMAVDDTANAPYRGTVYSVPNE